MLVELDIQEALPGSGMSCRLPRLLEGGVVLQALWEVRLPWSMAGRNPAGLERRKSLVLVGLLVQARSREGGGRPLRMAARLLCWRFGHRRIYRLRSDQSDRYLFSRRGQPTALEAWIVPGAWLVGVCSGLMLVVGFLAIFFRFRFRTIWLAAAALAVLAAVLVEPSVSLLVLQSAWLGAVLSLLGLMIERTIERANVGSTRAPARAGSGHSSRGRFRAQGAIRGRLGRFHGDPRAGAVDARPPRRKRRPSCLTPGKSEAPRFNGPEGRAVDEFDRSNANRASKADQVERPRWNRRGLCGYWSSCFFPRACKSRAAPSPRYRRARAGQAGIELFSAGN